MNLAEAEIKLVRNVSKGKTFPTFEEAINNVADSLDKQGIIVGYKYDDKDEKKKIVEGEFILYGRNQRTKARVIVGFVGAQTRDGWTLKVG